MNELESAFDKLQYADREYKWRVVEQLFTAKFPDYVLCYEPIFVAEAIGHRDIGVNTFARHVRASIVPFMSTFVCCIERKNNDTYDRIAVFEIDEKKLKLPVSDLLDELKKLLHFGIERTFGFMETVTITKVCTDKIKEYFSKNEVQRDTNYFSGCGTKKDFFNKLQYAAVDCKEKIIDALLKARKTTVEFSFKLDVLCSANVVVTNDHLVVLNRTTANLSKIDDNFIIWLSREREEVKDTYFKCAYILEKAGSTREEILSNFIEKIKNIFNGRSTISVSIEIVLDNLDRLFNGTSTARVK